jgi:hypothetical protein
MIFDRARRVDHRFERAKTDTSSFRPLSSFNQITRAATGSVQPPHNQGVVTGHTEGEGLYKLRLYEGRVADTFVSEYLGAACLL